MSIAHIDQLIDETFPQIHGWCPPDKAKHMARLVIEAGERHPTKAPTCVELGVFGGRGIIAMGLACKHVLRAGTVIGIDPYTKDAALEGVNAKENEEWWGKLNYQEILDHCRSWLARLDLGAFVTLKIARSQDVVSEFADASIDVLHQDSNHSAEVTCAEVALWTPKVKFGAFWVFDDTDWSTTLTAQERLQQQHGFSIVEDRTKWRTFKAPES
jgi:hypothetical protein